MMNDRFSYDGWDERKEELDEEQINWDDPSYCRDSKVPQSSINFKDDGYGKYIKVFDDFYEPDRQVEIKKHRERTKVPFMQYLEDYDSKIGCILEAARPVLYGKGYSAEIKDLIKKDKAELRNKLRELAKQDLFSHEFPMYSAVDGHIEFVKKFISKKIGATIFNNVISSGMLVGNFNYEDVHEKFLLYDAFNMCFMFDEKISLYNRYIINNLTIHNIIIAEIRRIREACRGNNHSYAFSPEYKFEYSPLCVWANLLAVLTIIQYIYWNRDPGYRTYRCRRLIIKTTDDCEYSIPFVDNYFDNRFLGTGPHTISINKINELLYILRYIADNAYRGDQIKPMIVSFEWGPNW